MAEQGDPHPTPFLWSLCFLFFTMSLFGTGRVVLAIYCPSAGACPLWPDSSLTWSSQPLCPLSPPLPCPSLLHQILITLTQHPEVRPGMALAANCSVTALAFRGNWPGPDPTLALQFGFLRPEAAACRFLE